MKRMTLIGNPDDLLMKEIAKIKTLQRLVIATDRPDRDWINKNEVDFEVEFIPLDQLKDRIPDDFKDHVKQTRKKIRSQWAEENR